MRTSSRTPRGSVAPRHHRLREALWLAGPLCAGLALRLWLASRNAGLTMDSATYVRMAEDLLAGVREPTAPADPGFPALIALASRLLPGRELPGRAVSFLMGVVVIGLTYGLARTRLSRPWSALAAGLVALHPLLAVYSGPIMSETTFHALTYGTLLLVMLGHLAGAGGLLGIAYAVRPEAIVLAVGSALFGRLGRRGVGILLAAFLVATLPTLAYLRWERGAWVLSAKAFLVRPPAAKRKLEEFRVSPPTANPGQIPAPALSSRWDPRALAAHYLPNLRRHLANLVRAWPWPLLALSLLGIGLRGGVLLAPLLVLAGLPLVDVMFDPRFVLVVLPALAVFAADGAGWLSERVQTMAPVAVVRRGLPAVTAGIALFGLAMSWGSNTAEALVFDDGPMPQLRAAGEWLRANGEPTSIVMDRKSYVPFYAGMRHVQLPDDDYDTIVEWARRTGVNYIVVEEYVLRAFRPQLRALVLDPAFRARESRLRMVYSWREGLDSGVAIFEVVREPGGGRPGPP